MQTHESRLFPDHGGGSRGESSTASIAFVAALLFALFVTWSDAAFGPRSAHMASHILVMNAIAPLTAIGWARFQSAGGIFASDRALIAGFVLQIGVFYAWHLPGVVGNGESRPVFHGAMHLALLGSAFVFWAAILSLEGAALWRGIIALTLTGKLACLLGALLLLAPRLIDGGAGAGSDEALHDQRTAGLVMLAACPLCYLATAVHMVVKWLGGIEARAARLYQRQVIKTELD